jgi:hypothetical protein
LDAIFPQKNGINPGANDAHPPHDIIGADGLVASDYNALRKSDKLWGSTPPSEPNRHRRRSGR